MKRALLALLALGLGSAALADTAPSVLDWANGLRDGGAAPLAADDALARTAAAYAGELAAAGVLSHESPVDGSGISERYGRQGGTEIFVAELLGAGPDLARIEGAWEASEAHRRAVTNARYTRLGAGTAPFGNQQVWVVVLARKVIDDLRVRAVGTDLLIEGKMAEPWAPVPFLEDAATMTPQAPASWQPDSRQFAYAVAGGASGGHWLLGFRSAQTGNPEITNSITWPRAPASPGDGARSAAP